MSVRQEAAKIRKKRRKQTTRMAVSKLFPLDTIAIEKLLYLIQHVNSYSKLDIPLNKIFLKIPSTLISAHNRARYGTVIMNDPCSKIQKNS